MISPTRKGAARRPCFHMVGAEPPAPGSPGPPHSVFLPTLCLCSRPPCLPIPEHLLAGVRASPSQPLALSLTAQTSPAQHSTHQLKAHCLFRAGDSGTQPPWVCPRGSSQPPPFSPNLLTFPSGQGALVLLTAPSLSEWALFSEPLSTSYPHLTKPQVVVIQPANKSSSFPSLHLHCHHPCPKPASSLTCMIQ